MKSWRLLKGLVIAVSDALGLMFTFGFFILALPDVHRTKVKENNRSLKLAS